MFIKVLLLQTKEIQWDELKLSSEGASLWEVQSQRPGGQEEARPHGLRKTKSLRITKVGRLVQQRHFLHCLSINQLLLLRTYSFSPRQTLLSVSIPNAQETRQCRADIQYNHVARITLYLTNRLAHGVCLIPWAYNGWRNKESFLGKWGVTISLSDHTSPKESTIEYHL